VLQRYPALSERRVVYETLRRMINQVITDLIESSRVRLTQAGVESIDAARRFGQPLIGYSDNMRVQSRELKRFLRRHLYAHERVRRVSDDAAAAITNLFDAFMRDPRQLPPQFRDKIPATAVASDQARVVADYIAGMTDRYAYREHARLGLSSA
jgi:dGTPase